MDCCSFYVLWCCGIINILWVDYGVYGIWCYVIVLCVGFFYFWYWNVEGVVGRDFWGELNFLLMVLIVRCVIDVFYLVYNVSIEL